MAPGIEVSWALRLAAAVVLAMPAGAAPAQRPPIVGVAKFAAKTNDLGAERTFFGSVLGFGEVFASASSLRFSSAARRRAVIFASARRFASIRT